MSTTDMEGTGNGNGPSSITLTSSPAISKGVVTMPVKIGKNGYYLETGTRTEIK